MAMSEIILESATPIDNSRGRNDRFAYAKVSMNGEEVFVKRALSFEDRDRLKHEVVWAEFMDHVAAMTHNSLRGVGEVNLLGDDGVVMPYVNTPHLVDDKNIGLVWAQNVDRYAIMLAQLDAAAESWTTTSPLRDSDRLKNYERSWDRWFGETKDRFRYFDEARTAVEDNKEFIESRFQHGDLTPYQIFVDDQAWVIYDGESCGFDLPRYYDLAYGYGRLAANYRDRSAASRMLRLFIDQLGIDIGDFEKSFMPVIIMKTVGIVSDAYHDERKNNYVKEAEMLLEDCLKGDITKLL